MNFYFFFLLFQIFMMLIAAFCIGMLLRNERVYSFRIKLLYESYETYVKLPSYRQMMMQFWKPLKSYLE